VVISLLLLKVDLTTDEKERFVKLVKEDLKAAKALSKNFKFESKEVKKPYSHSVLVKPNDYAKQEDILVNDLRNASEKHLDLDIDNIYFDAQGNLDLNRAYFNALKEVEDTNEEISILLREYTKTLDEEGTKEAKILFTQKDGIEDLSEDLKTQVKELNKVVKKNLEIRVAAYIKLMKEELSAVKVKDKKDFSSSSEKEILQPDKKDSILNAYYSKKTKSIENTIETMLKLIKRLRVPTETKDMTDIQRENFVEKDAAKDSLFKILRKIGTYLNRSREIRPVGTTEIDGKEKPNIDVSFDRHKAVLEVHLKDMMKTVKTHYERENELKDRINALQMLLGGGELGLIEELKVKDTTLRTIKKIAKAIEYKGSLADFVKKTLLEKNENAVRRNNIEIRKRLETILGKEVLVINNRLIFFESMAKNRNHIKKKDIRNKGFVNFEDKGGKQGYSRIYEGYSDLMESGNKINQELNKRVDSRTLFEYILDYAGEKGATSLKPKTQKRRQAFDKLPRNKKLKVIKEISEKIQESPLIEKYEFDKLQNLLLSDYDVIEEAVDEMETRGITNEEFVGELTEESFMMDYIEKINSTYFPSIPPRFYPMSEGQKMRMRRLLIKNIRQFTNKVGEENLTVSNDTIQDLIQQFNREQGNVEEE